MAASRESGRKKRRRKVKKMNREEEEEEEEEEKERGREKDGETGRPTSLTRFGPSLAFHGASLDARFSSRTLVHHQTRRRWSLFFDRFLFFLFLLIGHTLPSSLLPSLSYYFISFSILFLSPLAHPRSKARRTETAIAASHSSLFTTPFLFPLASWPDRDLLDELINRPPRRISAYSCARACSQKSNRRLRFIASRERFTIPQAVLIGASLVLPFKVFGIGKEETVFTVISRKRYLETLHCDRVSILRILWFRH